MFKSALFNYILYFKKFFKVLGIMCISLIIFYTIYNISGYLPFTDMENYNTFIFKVMEYVDSVNTSMIFESTFLSDSSTYLYELFLESNPGFNWGTGLIIISSLIVVGAFSISYMDCKKTIKGDVRDRETLPNFFECLFRGLISAVSFLIYFIVSYYWPYAILYLPVMLIVGQSIKILLVTWFVYFRKYKILQFVNLKNTLRIIGVNVVLMYLHSLLFIYIGPYLSFYMLLLLALSFFSYTYTITQFTAIKYFLGKRKITGLTISG